MNQYFSVEPSKVPIHFACDCSLYNTIHHSNNIQYFYNLSLPQKLEGSMNVTRELRKVCRCCFWKRGTFLLFMKNMTISTWFITSDNVSQYLQTWIFCMVTLHFHNTITKIIKFTKDMHVDCVCYVRRFVV